MDNNQTINEDKALIHKLIIRTENELKKVIKSYEFAVSHLPKVWVFDATIDSLCHGAKLNLPGISRVESEIEKSNAVAVLSLKNELIGVGKALMNSEEMIEKEKGTAVVMDTIVMDIGTYTKNL